MPEPPKAYRDADHHAVSAVIKWVEHGVAPEKLIATKFNAAGTLKLSRPPVQRGRPDQAVLQVHPPDRCAVAQPR